MNHNIGRIVFALSVGLLVAYFSYQWITDPTKREERSAQIKVVEASRAHLTAVIGGDPLELVDALSPNRKVGKVYVFPDGSDWSVSGYYRRNDDDPWHPYLITLSADAKMLSLKVKDSDATLLKRAESDAAIEITP